MSTPDPSIAALIERYHELAHAMQSGVAWELQRDPTPGTPKHLRVGVNVALCDHSALVKLLIAKGLITEQEYWTAVVAEMAAEVQRYEERLSQTYGRTIRLG